MRTYRCRWCGESFKYPGIMRHGKFCKRRKAMETELAVIKAANEKHPYGLDRFISQSKENDDR